MTTTADFQVSIAVPLTATETFDHVCRVTDWWTNDIDGETRGLGSQFIVRFSHTFVAFEINEFIPGKTVSWLVTSCYLPWLADKTEWTGTTVRFDISEADSGSQVTLTHLGLREGLECFEMCCSGWQHFIGSSLLALIQTGSGTPMERELHVTTSIPSSSAKVFEAISRVSAWWSPEFEGNSQALGDVFTVRFGDRHMSECKVADISVGERITWEVTGSCLNWLENKTEWTGTQIIWVIQERDGSTQLTMTHKGIKPELECYNACQQGWEYFVKQSLFELITQGKGKPGIPQTTGDTNE